MLPFDLWADLVERYAIIEARRHGFVLVESRAARTTRSRYVRVRPASGGPAVTLRISDHRPNRDRHGRRSRLLSVRQAATGRLRAWSGFLASALSPVGPPQGGGFVAGDVVPLDGG